jgi:hypothetical protein
MTRALKDTYGTVLRVRYDMIHTVISENALVQYKNIRPTGTVRIIVTLRDRTAGTYGTLVSSVIGLPTPKHSLESE